jgi:hypothetical protein
VRAASTMTTSRPWKFPFFATSGASSLSQLFQETNAAPTG